MAFPPQLTQKPSPLSPTPTLTAVSASPEIQVSFTPLSLPSPTIIPSKLVISESSTPKSSPLAVTPKPSPSNVIKSPIVPPIIKTPLPKTAINSPKPHAPTKIQPSIIVSSLKPAISKPTNSPIIKPPVVPAIITTPIPKQSSIQKSAVNSLPLQQKVALKESKSVNTPKFSNSNKEHENEIATPPARNDMVHFQGKLYIVKSGDCLSSIAETVLGDSNKWTTLYALNKRQINNPDLIYPGQNLLLPDTKSGSSLVKLNPDNKYIVKNGDSLYKIAQNKLGNSDLWAKIYTLNKDLIHNPDLILPGMIINLPEKINET